LVIGVPLPRQPAIAIGGHHHDDAMPRRPLRVIPRRLRRHIGDAGHLVMRLTLTQPDIPHAEPSVVKTSSRSSNSRCVGLVLDSTFRRTSSRLARFAFALRVATDLAIVSGDGGGDD